MNIKKRLWHNKVWENTNTKSNFITKIEFFDDENVSLRCRYNYHDKTNINISCFSFKIKDILIIDLGKLGNYKVFINKNNLKLIRTDDCFQDHERHSFIAEDL